MEGGDRVSFLTAWFTGENRPGTMAYRKKMAKELHGLAIKYVTERNADNDDVIGHGGSLTVRGDEFLVFASGDIVFRTSVSEMDVSFLMSGDGAVITAPDHGRGGDVRSIIVHFVYHRK